ncbi:MAG: hypothetical protein AUG49_01730 [Catenulispora sp. 13_1_20CM_3_70_7]|jgi:hypothetical protein|nr:hypothetical protein [Catenulisporales bacterium]OLE28656.1 MAG: hypothetical protein AUG49_01730 [Catenulispora sp. 13_1_20CM_3_70_7]
MTVDADLFRRERRLQAEAEAVLDDLDLAAALEAVGDPIRTGSAALGVMVKPDIDVTTACPVLDLATFDAVTQLATRLTRHERVRQITFRNDTGAWNAEPDTYPDGLYLQVHYRSVQPRPREWNLDLWFVDQPERQPDLQHLRTLLPRLTDETRAAILRLKEEWTPRQEYGRTINGTLIYQAVLDGGVRTPLDFAEWLEQAGPGSA